MVSGIFLCLHLPTELLVLDIDRWLRIRIDSNRDKHLCLFSVEISDSAESKTIDFGKHHRIKASITTSVCIKQ